MLVHQSIRVKGKVQGVFFRATAKQRADELNINGFAQNLPDGSVLIEAEGDELALTKFMAWCKTGPKNAEVSYVKSTIGNPVGYKTFDIKRF